MSNTIVERITPIRMQRMVTVLIDAGFLHEAKDQSHATLCFRRSGLYAAQPAFGHLYG
jgi:hypothetical protein